MPVDVATLGLEVRVEQVEVAIDRLKQLHQTSQQVETATGHMGQSFMGLNTILGSLTSLLATVGVGLSFRALVTAVGDAQVATTQLNTVIAATGGAAGVTAAEAAKLAQSLQELTGVQNNQIIRAETMLLRYSSLGGDVFPKATKAALDLAAAMGGDVVSAAVTLSRALADPQRGVSMLQRQRLVAFEPGEMDRLMATYRQSIERGQEMLLGIITRTTAGMAEAYRRTLPGAFQALHTEVDSFMEKIGEAGFGGAMNRAINRLVEFTRASGSTAEYLGAVLGGALEEGARWLDFFAQHTMILKIALAELLAVQVVAWATSLVTALEALGVAAMANPLVALGVAVVALITYFGQWGTVIQTTRQYLDEVLKGATELFTTLLQDAKELGQWVVAFIPTVAPNPFRNWKLPEFPAWLVGIFAGATATPPWTTDMGPKPEPPVKMRTMWIDRRPEDWWRDLPLDKSERPDLGGLPPDAAQMKALQGVQAEAAAMRARLDIARQASDQEREFATTLSDEARQLEINLDVAKAFAEHQSGAVAEAVRARDEAKFALQDLMAASKEFEKIATPVEKAQLEVRTLSTYLSRGAIDADTYSRRLNQIAESLNSISRENEKLVAQGQSAWMQGAMENRAAATGTGYDPSVYRQITSELEIQNRLRALNLTVDTEEYKQAKAQLEVQEQLKNSLTDQQRALQIIAGTRTPRETYNLGIAEAQYLRRAGLIDANTEARQIEKLHDEMLGITPEAERMKNAFIDAGEVMGSAFQKAITGGEDLDEVLRGLATDINDIILRVFVTEPFEAKVKEIATNLADAIYGPPARSEIPGMPNGFGAGSSMSVSTATIYVGSATMTGGGIGDVMGLGIGGGSGAGGIDELMGGMGGVGMPSGDLMSAVQQSTDDFMSQFTAGFQGVLQSILGAFGFGGAGGGGFDWLGSIFSGVGDFFGSLFGFASGGIQDRPGLRMIGESGPEAVLPLTRGPGGQLGVTQHGGGGQQPHVNVTVINTTGEKVKQEEKQRPDGGRDVRITIGELWADDFKRGGASFKAWKETTGGARAPTKR